MNQQSLSPLRLVENPSRNDVIETLEDRLERNLTGFVGVFFTQEGSVIYDMAGLCGDNAMQTLAALEVLKQKIIAHKRE